MHTFSIEPLYENNSVVICCATNDHYALYCGVTIASIINHASSQYCYDIIILESNLHRNNKKKLLSLLQLAHDKKVNVSIRFFNVLSLIEEQSFYTRAHFTIEMYYRLYASSIFYNYDRVLYIDVDAIAQCDLAQLFNVEIGNNWVAACKDAAIVRMCLKGPKGANYYREKLMLDPYHEYFNSGVLLMNLKLWRENNVEKQLFNALRELPRPKWPDQDILNKVCHGHVLYLNSSWNRSPEYYQIKDIFSPELLEEYEEDTNNPGIIHYSGKLKGWYSQNINGRCDEWWNEAKTTSFLGEIIHYSLCEAIKLHSAQQMRDLCEITKLREYKWQLRKYRLLILLTFGKTRTRYTKKLYSLKSKIANIKKTLDHLQ